MTRLDRRRLLTTAAGSGIALHGLPALAGAGPFRSLAELEDGSALEADIAVVGAGAAGITIVRALAGEHLRVLLVESGGLDLDGPTQDLYDGEVVGLPYEPLVTTRQRFFGGTTNHWTGWSKPFHPIDFAPRPWLGLDGWPFGIDELLPHYRVAQELCELGPPVDERDLWREAGFELPPLDPRRFETVFGTRSPPTRFGSRYREDLARSANVTVLLNANLVRIGLDPASGRVDLTTLDGKRARLVAKIYVLACGGIENARLLLASNDVQAAGVGNQNDLVGRCFMEHPIWTVGEIAADDPYTVADCCYQRLVLGRPRRLGWVFTGEAQKELGCLNCKAMTSVETDRSGPVARAGALWRDLLRGEVPDDAASRVLSVLGDLTGLARAAWRKQIQGADVSKPIRGVALTVGLEPLPNPASRVTLAADRDALGMPKPRLDWRLSRTDGESLSRFARIMAAELDRISLGRVRLHSALADEGGGWALAGNLEGHGTAPDVPPMHISWHHMGTTRMSADPTRGVVDPECRVHGVDNLFVAGSSVFPTTGNGSPTLTLVALASRLAGHLERVTRA